jgi:N utilization substance protein A
MEVNVRLDPQTGEARVYSEKQVVDEVFDERFEVDIAVARRVRPDIQMGEIITIDSTPRDFGRIAAQTAKQVVLQGIKEVEREFIYGEFMDREGDLVTATVQRTARGNVILEMGKAEAVLPTKEQVEHDRYFHGQRIKVYLLEIRREERGPRLIVSRAHKNLITKLFEMEVPEIYNGAVEIKSVAREPGLRTKVAVAARQEGIDPVGSCVGMRGIRIQNIVNELNGEKIDVVQWSPDAKEFIAQALSPAQVVEVQLDMVERAAMVIVPDKQLSLAIGREGQNVRLAAKLTGWRIDIKSATALLEEEREEAQAREAAEAEAMATEAALANARVETRKVRQDGTVVYQNQHYGPLGDDMIGEGVQLRATPHKLYIYFHDRLLASYMLSEAEHAHELDEADIGIELPTVLPPSDPHSMAAGGLTLPAEEADEATPSDEAGAPDEADEADEPVLETDAATPADEADEPVLETDAATPADEADAPDEADEATPEHEAEQERETSNQSGSEIV